MGSWFWLNVPLALLFLGCWAGIPLYFVLTRWHREIEARHAEIAAQRTAAPIQVPEQAAPVETVGADYAGVAGPPR